MCDKMTSARRNLIRSSDSWIGEVTGPWQTDGSLRYRSAHLALPVAVHTCVVAAVLEKHSGSLPFPRAEEHIEALLQRCTWGIDSGHVKSVSITA